MAAVLLAARRSRGTSITHGAYAMAVPVVEGFALPIVAPVNARDACVRTAHMVRHRQASFG
jgi:hypothetical protein